jgi:hypothetical protein
VDGGNGGCGGTRLLLLGGVGIGVAIDFGRRDEVILRRERK